MNISNRLVGFFKCHWIRWLIAKTSNFGGFGFFPFVGAGMDDMTTWRCV